mmetsp:Transcript_52363/g.139426  ORF Transcript_52363/g.139426 Transcript_52363/m.139426 type:complete len:309 (+) Transcript_52363:409-1335(+)
MPQPAQMPDASALLVVKGVTVLPVLWLPHATTEREGRSSELPTKTQVECHIAVVRVHVQTLIFALLVSHDKRVVTVKGEDVMPPLLGDVRQHAVLEDVDHGPPTDLVQYNAVVVHTVWPPGRQPSCSKMVDLLDEHVAEHLREHFARKNLTRHMLAQNLRPSCARLVLEGRHEFRIEPLCWPPRFNVKECGMFAERLVALGYRWFAFPSTLPGAPQRETHDTLSFFRRARIARITLARAGPHGLPSSGQSKESLEILHRQLCKLFNARSPSLHYLLKNGTVHLVTHVGLDPFTTSLSRRIPVIDVRSV